MLRTSAATATQATPAMLRWVGAALNGDVLQGVAATTARATPAMLRWDVVL